MSKNYLFLLFFCASFLNLFAQSDCSGAQAYIVYALSNSKSALDANNITHAKHYAEKAKESFENVQASLKNCHCDEVDDLVYNAIDYLSKAKPAVKIEDAYYFAKKGRELAEATIQKLDACTVTQDVVATAPLNEADGLASIVLQQEQLKQQQKALEQKQAELNQKIIQKKEQELSLKKETLISKMELTVANNIKTFNDALSACDCNMKVLSKPINSADLLSKSIEDIRLWFMDTLEELSSNYTMKLKDCNR